MHRETRNSLNKIKDIKIEILVVEQNLRILKEKLNELTKMVMDSTGLSKEEDLIERNIKKCEEFLQQLSYSEHSEW